MKNTIEFFCSNELVDYKKSINLMEQRVKKINDNTESELLWFLEHPSVYTAGTSSKEKDLLNKNLLPVFKTNRGGEYTYHGPGQRVAYVMLDVRRRNYNIKSYIRLLEQWLINSLMEIGIKSYLIKDKIGIWVMNDKKNNCEEKIGSLGLRIRKGVSYHGISLNINPNIEYFSGIVPCGNEGSGVTSIEKIGVKISKNKFDNILISNFEKIFKIKIKSIQTLS